MGPSLGLCLERGLSAAPGALSLGQGVLLQELSPIPTMGCGGPKLGGVGDPQAGLAVAPSPCLAGARQDPGSGHGTVWESGGSDGRQGAK